MKVQNYIREDGSKPYEKWFKSIDVQAADKAKIALSRLELGNTSNIKWINGIGEYRINWGPGYRIYLIIEGEKRIIVFGGGTKKRQPSDITKVKKLHKEYKKRKQKGTKKR